MGTTEGVSSATETPIIPFVGTATEQMQVESWGRKTSQSASSHTATEYDYLDQAPKGATPGNGDKAVSFDSLQEHSVHSKKLLRDCIPYQSGGMRGFCAKEDKTKHETSLDKEYSN